MSSRVMSERTAVYYTGADALCSEEVLHSMLKWQNYEDNRKERQQHPEELLRSLRRNMKPSCTGKFAQKCQTVENIYVHITDNNNSTYEIITK